MHCGKFDIRITIRLASQTRYCFYQLSKLIEPADFTNLSVPVAE